MRIDCSILSIFALRRGLLVRAQVIRGLQVQINAHTSFINCWFRFESLWELIGLTFPFLTNLQQFLDILWCFLWVFQFSSSDLGYFLSSVECHVDDLVEGIPVDFGFFGKLCGIVVHPLIENSWNLSENLLEIGLKLGCHFLE